MASTDLNTTSSATAVRHDTSLSPAKPAAVFQWDDVTDAFENAAEVMEVGEMIHLDTFSLYAAMSAIELMDPKMDVGCGTVRDVNEVNLPLSLSDQQVINIMDQLLACEMSWLDAHTLPQTVFSCVYAQRITECPCGEVFNFLRLQLATMDNIVNLILDEKVAEEEDFISWTYGFRLRPLRMSNQDLDDQILEDILEELRERPNPGSEQDNRLRKAIFLRLNFRVQFYKTIKYLVSHSLSDSTAEADKLLRDLEQLASKWESCPFSRLVDRTLIDHIFDPSINRHLMTSTPPRTAPLLDVPMATKYLLRLLAELRALVTLRHMALPLEIPEVEGRGTAAPRHSLHVAIHAVESFCAAYNPKTLTRSLMSKLMVPEYGSALFQHEEADFVNLIATDIGLSRKTLEAANLGKVDALRDGVAGMFKCLCRNRSRQRRHLLRVLRWWDHYSLLACTFGKNEAQEDGYLEATADEISQSGPDSVQSPVNPASPGSKKGRHTSENTNLSQSKTPLEIVSYELSARLVIQHFLLGFEVELYQEYEYAAVYFYVGYTLTSMANATTSLATAGLQSASLHPVRFALYIMDEARLWLCRALYSTLEALSMGAQWDYSCQRGGQRSQSSLTMFGNDELWYEQRFGVVAGMINGPAYADYSSFLSFQGLQEESLRANSSDGDAILLRLKEAASGFLTARRKAEKAKRTAELSPPNVVTEEVLKIARVAIENSLVVSAMLRSYEKERDIPGPTKMYSVSFAFNRHRHFPVLEVREWNQLQTARRN